MFGQYFSSNKIKSKRNFKETPLGGNKDFLKTEMVLEDKLKKIDEKIMPEHY